MNHQYVIPYIHIIEFIKMIKIGNSQIHKNSLPTFEDEVENMKLK